jgi:uncharacterized membrane protein
MRLARILFGLALPAFGFSHFAYPGQTTPLVPAWLPFRAGWTYLTGAAHTAAGIGVLFSIHPRLAATMEAAMLGVFTILVWPPAVLATPTSLSLWTEFLMSWAIAAGAWVVAESMTPTVCVERGARAVLPDLDAGGMRVVEQLDDHGHPVREVE